MAYIHQPDETCAQTGIYTATHDSHSKPEPVFVIAGDKFPTCSQCYRRITFELREVVPLVREHPLFW
jgi:uncharacterized membrane protein